MPKVDILLLGYNEESKELDKYASTTTLIRAKDFNMVVDPGSHKSQAEYQLALKKFDLTPEDINYVFTTHEHLDHSRDIALFKNAEVIDRWGFHKRDEHRFFEDDEYEITKGVKRIFTPGHTINHCSLLVETDNGIVCVAGDLWWYEDLTPVEDPIDGVNQKELEKSRANIRQMADFIIPGHGGLVRIKDEKSA
jgi:glyoxylase-like metal-dependent hydrolase (beta-lactamase superfamily II)